MLMLITLLNDGALISIGYDRVKPNPIPEQWNLARLFIVATIMGAVAMGSSLLMLAAALDSNNPHGIFAGMSRICAHSHDRTLSLILARI
jgi:H+-transporting ATPase